MIETKSQPGPVSSLAEAPVPSGVEQLERVKLTPRVMNLNQVADLLNAHPKTVRLMAQAGKKIPGFRVGRLWRFSAARLFEWIDSPEAAYD